MNTVLAPRIAVLAALTGTCLSTLKPTLAEEFSWEVAGSLLENSSARTSDDSAAAMGVTYYFSPVDDDSAPYDLATFLNPRSLISIGATQSTLREPADNDGPFLDSPAETGIDSSFYRVTGRYVWPSTGWYAGVGASRGNYEFMPAASDLQQENSNKRTSLFAGKYFGSRTRVELGIDSLSASQVTVLPFTPPFGGAIGTVRSLSRTEGDGAAITISHVGGLDRLPFAISAGVGSEREKTRISAHIVSPPDLMDIFEPAEEIVETTRENSFGGSVEIYPTRAMSVGAEYTSTRNDGTVESDFVSLRANWFFLRNVSFGIAVGRLTRDGGGGYIFYPEDSVPPLPTASSTDSVQLSLLGRF